MKTCSRCKTCKNNTDFRPNKATKDGRQNYCKDCQRAYNHERAIAQASTMEPSETKKCSGCQTIKPRTEFFNNRAAHDGLNSYCKPCWTKRTDEARKRPDTVLADRIRARHKVYMQKYGITIEEYEALAAQQGNSCKICGKLGGVGRREHLMVDHSHFTGAVRGLLCGPCNSGLGMFGDDPERLKQAVAYLQLFT